MSGRPFCKGLAKTHQIGECATMDDMDSTKARGLLLSLVPWGATLVAFLLGQLDGWVVGVVFAATLPALSAGANV